MRIPAEFIESLQSRAVATDVVGDHVQLKIVGQRGTGLCPFHAEKTPSFSVNNDRFAYYCFGCHAKGSVFGFLMEHLGLTFVEAVEEVAQRYGMQVPRTGGPRRSSDHDELLELLDAAQRWFRRNLAAERGHKVALEYVKERRLEQSTLDLYGIGYAPPGWENLKVALRNREEAKLLRSGVLSRSKNNTTIDWFRNRLMFPIRNIRGEVVSFGGRALDEDGPKYLNGPETPVFQKRSVLFGLHEARSAGARMQRVLLVEGYMDVAMLQQHGVQPVVAPLGTSATREQFELLFRYTPEVVCCFDGDDAGTAAAWRALRNALPALDTERVLRFVFLPQGEDPDSIVLSEGAEAFRERVDQSELASSFYFRHLEEEHDFESPEYRARAARQASRDLKTIRDATFKNQMLAVLRDKVGHVPIDESVDDGVEPNWVRAAEPVSRTEADPVQRQDHTLASWLLEHAEDVSGVDPALVEKLREVAPDSLVCALLEFILKREISTSVVLQDCLRDQFGPRVDTLSSLPAGEYDEVGSVVCDLEHELSSFVVATQQQRARRAYREARE